MRILLLALLTSFSSFVFAQDDASIFDAITTNKLESLEKRLTDNVDICLGNKEEYLSKSEAIKALRGFLKEIKPRKMEKKHLGSSGTKKTNYRVATLMTQAGKYRVFVYFEKDKGDRKISEIRLDKI